MTHNYRAYCKCDFCFGCLEGAQAYGRSGTMLYSGKEVTVSDEYKRGWRLGWIKQAERFGYIRKDTDNAETSK